MKIKNPTSQDESGVLLFPIKHVDPPLRVKGAELRFSVYRGSLGM